MLLVLAKVQCMAAAPPKKPHAGAFDHTHAAHTAAHAGGEPRMHAAWFPGSGAAADCLTCVPVGT